METVPKTLKKAEGSGWQRLDCSVVLATSLVPGQSFGWKRLKAQEPFVFSHYEL